MKTAVSQMIKELQEKFPKEMGDMYERNQLLLEDIALRAKEMEKEYIKKGWLQDRDITFGDWQQEFEQWYSQEFKQQEQ